MKRLSVILFLLGAASAAYAQESGHVTGSLESTSNAYVKDATTLSYNPEDHFGSNNYLKLDYYSGSFYAGMQLEGYLPALVGFPSELDGKALSNLYVTWRDDGFTATAGTFYEQLGSGLLFRSWEDRSLGINNALAGVRCSYSGSFFSVKAFWGRPRFGMDFASTNVRGADVSLELAHLLGIEDTYLAIEGSALNRYEAVSDNLSEAGAKPGRNGWSARLHYERGGFFAKGEYVSAGKKYYDLMGVNYIKNGDAQLLETGFNGKGLGLTATFRRLEWMDSQIIQGNRSSANMLNYVPAMCTQYTYMLANLNPYISQTGTVYSPTFSNSGEIGAQVDAFYHFKRGSLLGGRRGMKLHGNFSTYYTLLKEDSYKAGHLLLRDMSLDAEKWIGKDFRLNLFWSLQDYNPTHGADDRTWLSNVFVSEMLYRWTKTFSTRAELQYRSSSDDEKDWMAALLEMNFAPKWSVWCSDMYNVGSTDINYYNFGVSYTVSRTRVALGYGRYRSGYVCSGGVCRMVPAYTGGSLSITTSF